MRLKRRLEGIVGAEGVEISTRLDGTPVAAPRTVAEARELFAAARTDSKSVQLLGLGSKLCWMRKPAEVSFAISTRRMSGIVEFEAGDGTITALAGSTMAELRDTVSSAGLELTPDVPRPASATLGGVLAAAASGPDRTRHGPSRLHVLGTRTLLASGEETRSGGRLVKNVTGYDLHRLYCGSYGTLAMITEASLRLFPAPKAVRALRYDFAELSEALEFASSLAALGVAPRTVTILNSRKEAAWCVHIGLAAHAQQVELELERLAAARAPDEQLDGEAAIERSNEVRDAEPDPAQSSVLHLASLPSRLKASCGELFDTLESLPHGTAVLQPQVATLDLAVEAGAAADLAQRVGRAREALVTLGSRVALRGAALDDCDLDPLGTPRSELALMQRLKATYDCDGLFAAGSFHGKL